MPKFKDVREDGFVFERYKRLSGGRVEERWLPPVEFARRRAAVLANLRERKKVKTPETRAKHAALVRAYKARNPQIRAMANRYRGDRTVKDPTSNPKFIRQFYLTRDRLTRCTGFAWHVDHVLALAKGGKHHEANLQVIPARLNLSKGAR